VNVGVSLFDGEQYYFRFMEPIARLTYLDPNFDSELFGNMKRDLEAHARDFKYVQERISTFDPTFAFSDGLVTFNGQLPAAVLDRLYRRLVHLPLPRRGPETPPPKVPRHGARVLRDFLESLAVPRDRIHQRVNLTKEGQGDLFGLRQRPSKEVPPITACIPNGTSVIIAEPLLIPRLSPRAVFDLGGKFRTYDEVLRPLARRTILKATVFLDGEDLGGKGRQFLSLSCDFSGTFSEVCDTTDSSSVAKFRDWLHQALYEAPLFDRGK
jgi:hypothetical protein